MRQTPPARAGLRGAAAAVVALGAGEVVSGIGRRSPSLLLSVGQEVIERAPPSIEHVVITLLGRWDKAGLVVAMVVVALGLGAVVGRASRRWSWLAALLYPLGAVLGVWAALAYDSIAPVTTVLAGVAAAGAGLVSVRVLERPSARSDLGSDGPEGGRREVLGFVARVAGVALVGAGAGRLVARFGVQSVATDVALPLPARPLSRVMAEPAFAEIPGLSPLFTPNRDFYRIDTALMVPRVDLDQWRLRVSGMVDRPFEVSYAELSSMPQREADITLSCVSNEIGGSLVGNARWQGVPLADLLRLAGVQSEATQVVGRSVDGWTGGFPTEVAMDGRPALVALGMNNAPLPVAHGFPARLVVPGLFGYVSATKWLDEIELTTMEAFDGYWVPRGWAKLGPVSVQSRIDVPGQNQTLPAGRRVVAGVAWAPERGIARVEVSVDGGAWQDATLAGELSKDAWRQWRYEWDAPPGQHRLSVRATDGRGELQVAERRRPLPSGATGQHTILVTVRPA